MVEAKPGVPLYMPGHDDDRVGSANTVGDLIRGVPHLWETEVPKRTSVLILGNITDF